MRERELEGLLSNRFKAEGWGRGRTQTDTVDEAVMICLILHDSLGTLHCLEQHFHANVVNLGNLRWYCGASADVVTCQVTIGVTQVHLNTQFLASLQHVLMAAPV